MKTKTLLRILAVILCTVMLMSVMSTMASAGISNYTENATGTYSVFKHTESTLAPGITQYINYAYDSAGKQVAYYVATADLSNEDVVVKTSYKEQYSTKSFGMTKLSEQMNFATDYYSDATKSGDKFVSEYYTSIAGINASFYNMATGQPSGRTVLDGVSIGDGAYGGFFALLDNGTAVIMKDSGTNNWDSIKNHVVQAIGGESVFILNGEYVTPFSSYCDTQYPHSAIGITADNKVVICTVDGNQEPYSIGIKAQGLADIMLEAGCVAALSLDGGGSATYDAKLEGDDAVSVVNRPSDGTERSISAGVIFGSKAAPSNVFDHLTMTVENLYVMPGATTAITVKGVSPAGTAAEIPANIVYECDNGTFADGVFTAGNTAKDTTVYAKVDGTVVGSATIHVVIPTSLNFSGPQVAAPYGKSVTVKLVPKYNDNGFDYTVSYCAANIGFDVKSGYGAMNGLTFTATTDTSVTTAGTIKAFLVANTDISATVPLKVGKESEVLFDFEENLDGWGLYDYYDRGGAYGYTTHTTIELADEETGKVHSGEHSMAIHLNFDERLLSGGYDNMALTYNKDQMTINTANGCIDVTGATNIGFWMYLPEGVDAMTLIPRLFFGAYNGTKWTRGAIMGNTLGEENPDKYKEGGWFYFDFDVSKYSGYQKLVLSSMSSDKPATFGSCIELYACDYLWENKAMKNVMPELTVYIDDFSVDYSSVKPDRNGPVFSDLTYACDGMADAQTFVDNVKVNNNILSFAAKVVDFAEDNSVGLDASTAKVYVDGYEVPTSFNNGVISVSGYAVTNGLHMVKFEMADLDGNYTTITRYINVTAPTSAATAYVRAKDTSITKIKAGSLYYIDVVSTDIANTQTVQVSFKVDSTNDWAPEGIEMTEGFIYTYTYDNVEKIVTITATKTATVSATGEATVISVPVRAWYWDGTTSTVYNTAQKAYNSSYYQPIDIQVFTKFGKITFADESTATFAGFIKCDHEIDGKADDTTLTSCWHVHTANAIADKIATCTENGYTGRTYCAACDSVVDWGTTIPATGHTYTVVDGVLQCACGELFNGVYTDGKTYVDGVVLDGWVENSFYTDGEKLVGINEVDGYYYDFGTDGVCEGKTKYTGLLEIEGAYYYALFGELASGWFEVDDEWMYFVPETLEAANGSVTTEDGITFDFVDGKTEGTWTKQGEYINYWYGPDFYHNTSKNLSYLETEIQGKKYFFNAGGTLFTKGYIVARESNEFTHLRCYVCGEDGVAVPFTGIYNDSLYVDAIRQLAYKLVKLNGDYYFVGDGNIITKNRTVYLGNSATEYGLKKGYYDFGADGKMAIKNGIYGDYLYINNELQTAYQMVEFEGNFYYITDAHKVLKNTTKYLNGTVQGKFYQDGTPMQAGYFTFDEEGKMVIKNGVYGDYLYINNVMQTAYQMVEYDGNFYYITDAHKVLKNATKYLNGTVQGKFYQDGTPMKAGNFTFDEEGKMVIKNGVYGDYLYINNVMQTAYQMVEYDGNFYYITDAHKVLKNATKYLNGTVQGKFYQDGTPMQAGYFTFDENGAMVVNN